MSTNCVCLIGVRPIKQWIEFLSTFIHYDVYIIIDDNTTSYSETYTSYKNIHIIQVTERECMRNGFRRAGFLGDDKQVTGWDKALYYFSSINISYNNIWFFEDDVFFYNEKTLTDIDDAYVDGDLLTSRCHENKLGDVTDWLWDRIDIRFPLPYYCSMICSVRVSNALLTKIKDYAKEHNSLFYSEALFASVCKTNNLLCVTPNELRHIVYRATYEDSDIDRKSLFHPVKDMEKHVYYRNTPTLV